MALHMNYEWPQMAVFNAKISSIILADHAWPRDKSWMVHRMRVLTSLKQTVFEAPRAQCAGLELLACTRLDDVH